MSLGESRRPRPGTGRVVRVVSWSEAEALLDGRLARVRPLRGGPVSCGDAVRAVCVLDGIVVVELGGGPAAMPLIVRRAAPAPA